MLLRIRDRSVDCDLKGQPESWLFWDSSDFATADGFAGRVDDVF